ncbi:hypothetical protein HY643_00835 [Candidatus Woesearchaeota archaeon]|nr:hypothetical protein [Candidatus Woesearchaeota archaeon]
MIRLARCPFVDRECTKECKAYDESKAEKCLVLHRSDRTNRLLNFIEKKIGGR